MPTTVTCRDLLNRYNAFLIDAYGVLITARGALPHARDFLAELRRRGRQFVIVTNDASRLPEQAAEKYQGFGLAIETHEILTAGSCLNAYFRENRLSGADCVVLGTEASKDYIRRAGGRVVELSESTQADVVAVCDDSGFSVLDGLGHAISLIRRQALAGVAPRLVLPNPDYLFPKGPDLFGVTSGSLALVIETALQQLLPDHDLRFDKLGKPFTPMFETALGLVNQGRDQVVMIGDQLPTDIQGANAIGIDSALVLTGLTPASAVRPGGPKPTFLLPSLAF